MNKNQKGFTAVEGLLILVIVGIIGGVSYSVYNSQKQANNSLENADKSSSVVVTKSKKEKPTESVPTGLSTYRDSQTGLTFHYPAAIIGTFTVKAYNIGEDIGLGYGAPVWVRYNSSNDKWQTYTYSADSTADNLLKVPTDNHYKELSSKVDNKSVILQGTGDGPGGQHLIMFNIANRSYEILMPPLTWDPGSSAESAKTDAQDSLQKNSVEQIVQSIKLN